MPHPDVAQFLGLLAILLGAAKLLGIVARWLGQAAVLGELAAGMILGPSVVGLIDPQNELLQMLAQVGVVVLLFEIGLETDLLKLLQVGAASTAVALTGVTLSFLFGYAACRLVGLNNRVAIVAGAALTATSVGITARVLADLGRLQEAESQVVLGAAILDDIIGLVILAVVTGFVQGQAIALLGVIKIIGIGLGFLAATLLLGHFLVPPLFRLIGRLESPGTSAMLAVTLAFGLAWLAAEAQSAILIGAFAAGLLLSGSSQAREINRGVTHIGHFFVPLFFVMVGATVDIRLFNPLLRANHATLLIGGLLILAAVAGKLLAGYAPVWFRGKKSGIGVGMIPRGEVSLIFAQLGLSSGIFDKRLFSAMTLMVVVTTFLAPPLLKLLFRPKHPGQKPPEPEGVEELLTEPI